MRYSIGYLYYQNYSFEKDGKKFAGQTLHAIFHKCADNGDILRTYDYKVSGDFAPYIATGACGAPRFDSFNRLVDVADIDN